MNDIISLYSVEGQTQFVALVDQGEGIKAGDPVCYAVATHRGVMWDEPFNPMKESLSDASKRLIARVAANG